MTSRTTQASDGPPIGGVTRTHLVAGTQIGAYRLLDQIGAGGMGAVWLAEHALLGRRAALKVLHPQFSARTDIVTRFFNEARAATSIADPGIVQIFDFGHHTDGSAYIVMELLDGETLEARCRRGISITDALRIIRQVASSLGAAHTRGIVHRDLKPENIFLVRDPEVPGGERVKILDFGIAKLGGDVGLKTQTATLMGTPMFMSPEQCRGAGEVDARADVYSLGCVLFSVLAGRAPFVAEGMGDLIVMHLTEPAPVASSVAPGIPRSVDQLISRCLQKAADARFATGVELAAAIGALLEQPELAAMERRRSASLAATPTTLSGSSVSVAPSSSSRRGRSLAFAAALALGAVLGAVAVSRSGGDARPGLAHMANSMLATSAPLPPPPLPPKLAIVSVELVSEDLHLAVEIPRVVQIPTPVRRPAPERCVVDHHGFESCR